MGRLAGRGAPHAQPRVNLSSMMLRNSWFRAAGFSRPQSPGALLGAGKWPVSAGSSGLIAADVMQGNIPKHLEARLATVKILIVDDDQYMRKVVRAMLTAIGIKHIHEANDGPAGLDAIRQTTPDIVIVDWEMPTMDGLQFIRSVRSPQQFPLPDVPIILLTGHADRWRVIEAARFGVHEYLLKPVSTKALMERIASVLLKPRKMVQIDGYYGPEPRKLVILPEEDKEDDIFLLR